MERLLAGMTLEDKVGEMTQLTLDMLCVEDSAKTRKNKVVLDEPHRLDENKLDAAFDGGRIGSVLNCGGHAYPTAMASACVWIQASSVECQRFSNVVWY